MSLLCRPHHQYSELQNAGEIVVGLVLAVPFVIFLLCCRDKHLLGLDDKI